MIASLPSSVPWSPPPSAKNLPRPLPSRPPSVPRLLRKGPYPQTQNLRLGGFGGTPNLRFVPSPGPSKLRPGELTPAHGVSLTRVPALLVNLEGRCVYASKALAALLQCGVHELLGDGWRARLSPYTHQPFDVQRSLDLAKARIPIRLHQPGSNTELVSRIRVVTDLDDPTKVTGFFGRVQVVRVHRRPQAATA